MLGWDIGGAHIKAALCIGGRITRVWLVPCPLWRDLAGLRSALAAIAMQAGAVRTNALTMTGELADIFVDRAEGVRHLLDAFHTELPEAHVQVYAHPQRLLSSGQACRAVMQVASANWSACAAWLARRVDNALFVDMGSTTTDLVPIEAGCVAARGHTDTQRLAHDELIYTGAARTPVMAMVDRVPYAGQWLAPMAEVFATSADVHRVLGTLPAEADLLPSADGRGKSRLESARRLGRMIGVDVGRAASMTGIASYVAQAQLWHLQRAALRVLSAVTLPSRAPVVGAGVGRFVVQQLALRLGRPYRDMSAYVPARPVARTQAVDCAPAACVALLAHDAAR